MYLKLLLLIFVLLIERSQSIDIITPGQILVRITALEKKDLELTELNTRLLAMVESLRGQMKQKDMTINQLLKQVHALEQKETDTQSLWTEVNKLQAGITALQNKAIKWTDITRNEDRDRQMSEETRWNDLESLKETSTEYEVLNAIIRNNKSLSQTRKYLHLVKVKHNTRKEKALTRKIRQTSSAPELVAFHAVNNLKHVSHIGINQNVVFETVLLNLASAYHAQHGIFIAPTNGLYLFSTSIMADSYGKVIYTELVKNGDALARTHGQGHSGSYDQSSVTVVTQLNTSDEVWVRVSCCADDSLYGSKFTTFTGVMLQTM